MVGTLAEGRTLSTTAFPNQRHLFFPSENQPIVLPPRNSATLATHLHAMQGIQPGRPAEIMRQPTAKKALVRHAQLPVHEMEQPRRTNQQELNIFEKAGLFAFDFVADELADPGQHKNDERGEGKLAGIVAR